ncbi:bleomycin resistance protein [Mesorhizobium ephedrae]|uniref:Bleomycin resistance protein n=2 Tax=Kumtagia ephedrae TaxID=2116701 RepID=A0A2P7STD8_9HYPH|nr:VOC family protein [Mesorhizobium ephedrae]PSJ65605.1 bleomycin resistance protein [Mesorhizobium ephedrae]
MTKLPFAADAPVSVAAVGIKARDVNALADYYKDAVGLAEVSRRPGVIVLGAGGLPLLEIEEFRAARPDDPRAAGLYHTAFLLPSRLHLAKWTRQAIDRRIEVTGASDHFVSEAIYLTDPEGNGIEIYADRPRDAWSYEGGGLKIGTVRLDVDNLLGELRPGDSAWVGAPEGSMVGHVHLRVGNAGEAERWWNDELGFDTIMSLGGSAVFLSTGGYHHHVGANSWQSAGAKDRDPDRSGLSFVEFRSKTAAKESVHEDPWGNVVRIVPA